MMQNLPGLLSREVFADIQESLTKPKGKVMNDEDGMEKKNKELDKTYV